MRFLVTLTGAILAIVLVVGGAQAGGRDPQRQMLDAAGHGERGQTVEIWASGLPTKTALNVFVTDAHGTYGWGVGVQPVRHGRGSLVHPRRSRDVDAPHHGT